MISRKDRDDLQQRLKDRGVVIPEDNRKVLVAKRREGKTDELIKVAYRQLEEGKNVLWVSQRTQIQKFTIKMFLEADGMKYFKGIYNEVDRKVSFYNGASIIFKTIEEVKGPEFMSKDFKDYYSILDNAALSSYDFDLISINGELYDE